VSAVAPDGLACGALGAGDLLVYVGGLRAASPSEATRQLRELCGEVTLLVTLTLPLSLSLTLTLSLSLTLTLTVAR